MKITTSQKELDRALGIVNRATRRNDPNPIVNKIHFSTDGGDGLLILRATNLEIEIEMAIGARIDEPGYLVFPARLVNDYVKTLRGEEVSVETAEGISPPQGIIKCGRNRSTLECSDGDLFPPASKKGTNDVTFSVSKADFRNAIGMTTFAASRESEARPILTGCQFGVDGDRYWIAATDGFRLAWQQGILHGEVPDPSNVTIPSKALDEVRRIISGDGEVEITLQSSGRVLFEVSNASMEYVKIRSMLLQGQYPDWESLIPGKWDSRFTLGTAEVQRLVKLAGVFTDKDHTALRLWANPPDRGKDEDPGVLTVIGKSRRRW